MRFRVLLALAMVLVLASAARAGRFNRTKSIGDAAPTWSDLPGADGKSHSLKDYDQARLLVQVITCNYCPCANACEERFQQIQRDYAKRGVQVVAINVGQTEYDTLQRMKQRVAQRKLNFPYLRDTSQATARELGARVTPQVFVLDDQRKIAYMGALDDNMLDAKSVKKPYLRDALDALLDGKQPRLRETRPSGCAIEYE